MNMSELTEPLLNGNEIHHRQIAQMREANARLAEIGAKYKKESSDRAKRDEAKLKEIDRKLDYLFSTLNKI